jgi:NMD protein affecting ribosome stability and mRNA decay
MRPKSTPLTPINLTRKSRGLIRSLNRSFARDEKSPQVVRKTAQPAEPTVCARCGAVFLRKTWRHDHQLSDELLERRQFGFCPACEEVSRLEGQGRLIIRGSGAVEKHDLIRSRIENVARRAMRQQPERRIVSIDTTDSDGKAIEVLTTSQKLTHRIAHELKKLFGGRTSYAWSDDGTLFATWEFERPRPKRKQVKSSRA